MGDLVQAAGHPQLSRLQRKTHLSRSVPDLVQAAGHPQLSRLQRKTHLSRSVPDLVQATTQPAAGDPQLPKPFRGNLRRPYVQKIGDPMTRTTLASNVLLLSGFLSGNITA